MVEWDNETGWNPSCCNKLEIVENRVRTCCLTFRYLPESIRGSLTSSRPGTSQLERLWRRWNITLENVSSPSHMDHSLIRCKSLAELKFKRLDYSLIKGWMAACSHNHANQCLPKEALSTPPEFLFWLIDTTTMHVIKADLSWKFMALSYVWRGWLDEENQSPHLPRCVPKTAPRTVQDAIVLANSLGCRYLWVDSYCISTNPAERHVAVANMDSIYQRSCLTICVLSGGHANAGIPGISRDISSNTQIRASFNGRRLMATRVIPLIYSLGPWDTRCWTLQEGVLAKRRLCISDDSYFMVCGVEVFHDALVFHSNGKREPKLLHRSSTSNLFFLLDVEDDLGEKAFEKYALLVRTYTRQLTYPSDRPEALRGILKRFSSLRGLLGFVYAIPKCDFCTGLMWTKAISVRVAKESEMLSFVDLSGLDGACH